MNWIFFEIQEFISPWEYKLYNPTWETRNKETSRWTHVTNAAVIPCFDIRLAVVASVNKPVPALVMELVEKTHGRKLGTSERRELVVLVARQSEKGVSSVHQITVDLRVGIDYRSVDVVGLKSNDEKSLRNENNKLSEHISRLQCDSNWTSRTSVKVCGISIERSSL